jgi:hypothetical protein
MPSGHYTQGGRRDAQGRYEDRGQHEGRGQARSGGGRSESYARDRDREQQHAGYSPREWERDEESYRTVHSEPDWDPNRISRGRRDPGYDAQPSGPRDDERRSHHGYDETYELEQRRLRSAAGGRELRNVAQEPNYYALDARYGNTASGSRHSSSEFEHDYRQHELSVGSEIGNAGRRLIGKIKRLVRNPKNYTRSDERIREDVCDRLAVSHEVDPSEIEVTVSSGEVTLTGIVSNRQMKFVAEEIADDVVGVHDVHNQLRVSRPAPMQSSGNTSINSQDAGRGGKNIGRS